MSGNSVGSGAGNGAKGNGKPKIASRIAAELRREIVTGKLRPGDRLRNERELQEQFGISRPTLREALRMLEAESLIVITRGQHGGARVTRQDPMVLARNVGTFMQMQGVTLRDVWDARISIEPQAARLLTESGNAAAIAEMQANIVAAREQIDDPVAYGQLTNEFSLIITRHCGNQTLHILATLLQDIVARQHVDVTVRTYARSGVDRMRELNIRSREKMLSLIREGDATGAENHWREHLEGSGKVVFSTYQARMPIDMVQLP